MNCNNCYRCLENVMVQFSENFKVSATCTRMIVCPACGNKRCPKATDHRFSCTGSNEPGQAGSIYKHVFVKVDGQMKNVVAPDWQEMPHDWSEE